MNPPDPSGVITLTTDFGDQGPFVGVMKGAILTRFPQARLVDLTHEILVHWPAEAGFWLARAYQYFPPGTVHVAVVDPGVGTARDIIAVRAAGHVFLAPDNGLLAPVVARLREALIVKLSAATLARARHPAPERDLPRPRHLCPGGRGTRRRAPAARGPRGARWTPWCPRGWRSRRWTPAASPAMVITQDHFGNLITNIDARPDRALPPAAGARRQPFLSPAAHLRGYAGPGSTWRW